MKIFMVMHTPLFPLSSGGVRRNFHLVREAAREHEVRVLVLAGGHDAEGFRASWGPGAPRLEVVDTGYRGKRRVLADTAYIVTGMPLGRRGRIAQHAIDRQCREFRPDLLHLSSPFLARFAFPGGIPVVADAHNVEHDYLRRLAQTTASRTRRLYFGALGARLRRDEQKFARRCTAILCVSEHDREFFSQLTGSAAPVLVPNGVDLEGFVPRGISRRPRSLVFAGRMDYPPNEEAVLWFVDRCLPNLTAEFPDVSLTVVGPGPSPAVRRRASRRVKVLGRVEDIRPYLEQAEVSIVPLRAGGGTRLKILESMAMATPVVSTTIGCEGLETEHAEHLLIADAPEEFTRAVSRLFRERSLRRSLSGRGLDLVRERYGWDRIGTALRHAYETIGVTYPGRMMAVPSLVEETLR